MKRTTSRAEKISLCFRMILGIIFLYAGLIKVLDPQGFALVVYNYHILPGFLINLAALILPLIEVIVGAALILGVLVPGASLIVSSLLIVFLCAIAAALIRGLDVSCGCFNTSQEADPLTWMYLVRDTVLLAMACFVFTYDQGHYGVVNLIRGKDQA
ncbi:MAG TPA: MauE/DoxX family redox-associated membrane protein [Deltaproteobacteria bacterium]|nr:MauE/DoxX family redox-associated membrane protein [Deltaproteobacteria bacterium]